MRGRTVIDGNGLILGRMASIVSKRLLAGEAIDIVNAEKVVVSGKRLMVIKKKKEFLEVGGHGRGPIHYRQPHRMVRRSIRGMLPYRKTHGREAFKRLRVFVGVPEELEGCPMETLEEAHKDRLGNKYVTVGEIAENIGWKK
ncbi:MAG TPA: 50S ribosomal protein L13 [Candidatus Bathyarchaeota archaeon]|nr:50S ribosomal protein L13 [Candidatus Bathyarchaeota archaeon]